MYLYMYNNKIPKNVSFKCSAMGYGASMGGSDQARASKRSASRTLEKLTQQWLGYTVKKFKKLMCSRQDTAESINLSSI